MTHPLRNSMHRDGIANREAALPAPKDDGSEDASGNRRDEKRHFEPVRAPANAADSTQKAAKKPIALVVQLRRELIGAFVASGCVTIFLNIGLLFVPIYEMILFDRVLRSRNMDTVSLLSIGITIAMIIFAALEFCRSAIFVVMADRLARRLNLPTLQAAMTKSLEGASSVAAQAMRDLNELRLFAASYAAAVPLDMIWTPVLIGVLYLLHPAYGVYAVLCAGFLFVLSLLTDLSTREDLVRANNADSKSLNDLTAALRHTELLDGLGMLPAIVRRWNRRQQQTLDDVKRAARRQKGFATLARVARLTMQAGVIALGALLVLRYEATPGSMVGSNVLLARLLIPFEQLVSGWRQWTSALAAWRRVRDLVGQVRDRTGDHIPDHVTGRLAIDDVSFSPTGAARPILENVSFVIEPGEAVGIVGPSGSGKSTLARLVVGIFDPSIGEIRIDGTSTQRWDRRAFAQHVGYLPQAISLLEGTILDNIARMEDADPALVIEAAAAAGVHELVGRLPEGYSTRIGGAGYVLSGGQQQRVALARSLFGHPKLLVLDEPNSNLDHVGEQSLVDTIASAKHAGVAVMLITHRPAVLGSVDRIITLKEGRIASIVSTQDYFNEATPPAHRHRSELSQAETGTDGRIASASVTR